MRLLTRQQVSEMLQINIRSVDALIKRGAFPIIKFGDEGGPASVRIDEDDVVKWVNSKKNTINPLE